MNLERKGDDRQSTQFVGNSKRTCRDSFKKRFFFPARLRGVNKRTCMYSLEGRKERNNKLFFISMKRPIKEENLFNSMFLEMSN